VPRRRLPELRAHKPIKLRKNLPDRSEIPELGIAQGGEPSAMLDVQPTMMEFAPYQFVNRLTFNPMETRPFVICLMEDPHAIWPV
jgi:hypothetical protein